MYDIVVNGSVVAVVIKDLVKPFVETLIKMLPEEMSITTKVHEEPKAETVTSEKK